jgi:hypothetical protein
MQPDDGTPPMVQVTRLVRRGSEYKRQILIIRLAAAAQQQLDLPMSRSALTSSWQHHLRRQVLLVVPHSIHRQGVTKYTEAVLSRSG